MKTLGAMALAAVLAASATPAKADDAGLIIPAIAAGLIAASLRPHYRVAYYRPYYAPAIYSSYGYGFGYPAAYGYGYGGYGGFGYGYNTVSLSREVFVLRSRGYTWQMIGRILGITAYAAESIYKGSGYGYGYAAPYYPRTFYRPGYYTSGVSVIRILENAGATYPQAVRAERIASSTGSRALDVYRHYRSTGQWSAVRPERIVTRTKTVYPASYTTGTYPETYASDYSYPDVYTDYGYYPESYSDYGYAPEVYDTYAPAYADYAMADYGYGYGYGYAPSYYGYEVSMPSYRSSYSSVAPLFAFLGGAILASAWSRPRTVVYERPPVYVFSRPRPAITVFGGGGGVRALRLASFSGIPQRSPIHVGRLSPRPPRIAQVSNAIATRRTMAIRQVQRAKFAAQFNERARAGQHIKMMQRAKFGQQGRAKALAATIQHHNLTKSTRFAGNRRIKTMTVHNPAQTIRKRQVWSGGRMVSHQMTHTFHMGNRGPQRNMHFGGVGHFGGGARMRGGAGFGGHGGFAGRFGGGGGGHFGGGGRGSFGGGFGGHGGGRGRR